MHRNSSEYSLVSQELNDSNSSLDLSIKEALNTLKTHSKRQNSSALKVSISSRTVGRAYSNSLTPKSRGNKVPDFNKNKGNLGNSSSIKNFSRKPKNFGEIDEFLEAEKLALKEGMTVKVNLRGKDVKKPLAKENGYAKLYNDSFSKNKTKSAEKIKNLIEDLKSPTSVQEKNSKPLITTIRNHRDFIINAKKSNFSSKFVIRAIFCAWKNLVKKIDLMNN